MPELRLSRAEQNRMDIVADLEHQLSVIKERGDDRVRCLWALKMIAENVARLDETDREEGFLPIQVRPALMLDSTEAALALHTLREYTGRKGNEVSRNTLALLEKFNFYFDGRI
jgi:hypothetical protein